MSEISTWTDAELTAHLAEWNVALRDGNPPKVTFQTARREPRFELGYEVLLPEGGVITLTLAQALKVDEWIKACSGMPVHLRVAPPKHDGYLAGTFDDWRYHVTHRLGADHKTPFIEIAGSHASYGEDTVELSPAEALSLLAWLQQEKAELQRLAKEQGQ